MNTLRSLSSDEMRTHFQNRPVDYARDEFYATAKFLMTTFDLAEMEIMIRWAEAAEWRMGTMCRVCGVVPAAKRRLEIMRALGMEMER